MPIVEGEMKMVHKYPIILGQGHRKGVAACRSKLFKSGCDLFIFRLNRDLRSGDHIGKDDIENVEAFLHFCDRESLKRTIDVLTEILLKWKEH